MKVGMIDVDGHNFPNLALMKIAAYHKSKGDQVEWYDPMFGGRYDQVYMSKVFTFTQDYQYNINADIITKGGTGYDLANKLPEEIEHQYPAYEIYPELTKNTAFGYMTRGCPRGCSFCIVAEKEGRCSTKVADLDEFWRGQKEIKLLDPNLIACKEHEQLLDQLIESRAWVDFTQGLDIRIMTDKIVEKLNQIKVRMLHFAWDNYEFKTYEKLKKYRPMFKQRGRDLSVYVLVNYNTTIEQDLDRVYKLRELDYSPYIMIYNKDSCDKIYKKLQRWVNNRVIWRTVNTFDKYEQHPK